MFAGEETGLYLSPTGMSLQMPAQAPGRTDLSPHGTHARRCSMRRSTARRERMSDYNPRTDTGIPTEPVGSLPRPSKLQAAYAEYDEGKISKEDLEKLQDEACKDSIEKMEATGSPIVSDGEQRWSSFATYPIADTLAGTGLADGLAPGGQF